MPVSSWHCWAHDFRPLPTTLRENSRSSSHPAKRCVASTASCCSCPQPTPSQSHHHLWASNAGAPLPGPWMPLPAPHPSFHSGLCPNVTSPQRHSLTDQKTSVSSFNPVTLFPERLYFSSCHCDPMYPADYCWNVSPLRAGVYCL